MAIGIPVSGLDSVSVLTRSEDLVRMTCRSTTALGPALKEVSDGSLLAATCETSRLSYNWSSKKQFLVLLLADKEKKKGPPS